MIEYLYACRQSVSDFNPRLHFIGRSNSYHATDVLFFNGLFDCCDCQVWLSVNDIFIRSTFSLFRSKFGFKTEEPVSVAKERCNEKKKCVFFTILLVLGWSWWLRFPDPRRRWEDDQSWILYLVLVTHLSLFTGGIPVGWENVQPERVQFVPNLQAYKKRKSIVKCLSHDNH